MSFLTFVVVSHDFDVGVTCAVDLDDHLLGIPVGVEEAAALRFAPHLPVGGLMPYSRHSLAKSCSPMLMTPPVNS